MNSFAPMSLSSGSAYPSFSAAPYAAAGPSYGAPTPFDSPIPLTPLVPTGDSLLGDGGAAAAGGGGGGFYVSKTVVIPFAVILPLLILWKLFSKKKDVIPEEVPYDYGAPEYVQRSRRETKSSSALPAMSIAQVDTLTNVVFAALRSQECIERLVCELGTMSKSYSNSTHAVAKAVKEFVPESIKDTYEVFANPDKCEQYKCGSVDLKE